MAEMDVITPEVCPDFILSGVSEAVWELWLKCSRRIIQTYPPDLIFH